MTYGLLGVDEHDTLRIIIDHDGFFGSESVAFDPSMQVTFRGNLEWARGTAASIFRMTERYFPGILPLICELDASSLVSTVRSDFLTPEGVTHYNELLSPYGLSISENGEEG